jgi:hypothetical protein
MKRPGLDVSSPAGSWPALADVPAYAASAESGSISGAG